MFKSFIYISPELVNTYETPLQIIFKKNNSRVSIDTTKNIIYTYDKNENILRHKHQLDDHKSNSA